MTPLPYGGRLTMVLLTYNCADRLSPTLDHLLSTGVPIVAADNASTDATRAVLSRHPEIEVVALAENIGAARRTSVQNAPRPRMSHFVTTMVGTTLRGLPSDTPHRSDPA